MEFMAPLPVTLVSRDRVTIGVVADPAEMPYRIPTFANSRFGVLVRNEKGQAQPMLFAPVLGTTDSHMIAGTPYQFRARFVIQPGDWFEAFRHVARDIYSFHDYRENVGGSLNDTLNNMIALVMDDHYSEWSPEYKGFGYSDVEGTVKIVSSLHPFSIALLTDNQEMYVRRALPMIEYAMSREKFLFSLQADNKGQSASHRMRGPGRTTPPCTEPRRTASTWTLPAVALTGTSLNESIGCKPTSATCISSGAGNSGPTLRRSGSTCWNFMKKQRNRAI